MRTRAALLWSQPGEFTVSEVELDEPGSGEVLVRFTAAGLCLSDDHAATGDMPVNALPWCAGHEGSGIVRKVGPGVDRLKVGDHIVTSFIPSCGHCRWCSTGLQNLCDNGALVLQGAQLDGNFRMHTDDGHDVGCMSMLGTFSEWQVLDQTSCVVIPEAMPLDVACLLACGVQTGFGSATTAAQAKPGDVVIVMGAGGIGMNAVQGAALAGARHVIAVDPTKLKLEVAARLGATETFAHMQEAADFARSVTGWQGADSAIVTVGVVTGEHVAEAFSAIRKGGTVVLTSLGSVQQTGIPVSLFELAMFQKRIQGAIYGMGSPQSAVPMLVDLYLSGRLKLDELITRRYRLDDINQAYRDLHEGLLVRGIIDFTL